LEHELFVTQELAEYWRDEWKELAKRQPVADMRKIALPWEVEK
jgi:hypothetical protein